ncbi:hypothetical protein HYDPIDRAFT_30920 [Hydnomerulius pinastri MD-312]|uniref:Uncharacterized protein n=1 Tax=Hydnomerulius pinastri MD-312 TaxID=994086 RepID=A0A0C9V843_9AGAM|nr:hypothetical protein HYDPIDRAFT_30920 [Hydnomerulius pinastri MD-312]
MYLIIPINIPSHTQAILRGQLSTTHSLATIGPGSATGGLRIRVPGTGSKMRRGDDLGMRVTMIYQLATNRMMVHSYHLLLRPARHPLSSSPPPPPFQPPQARPSQFPSPTSSQPRGSRIRQYLNSLRTPSVVSPRSDSSFRSSSSPPGSMDRYDDTPLGVSSRTL